MVQPPLVQRVVGPDRSGGFEHTRQYGEGANSAMPASPLARESLIVGATPQANRDEPVTDPEGDVAHTVRGTQNTDALAESPPAPDPGDGLRSKERNMLRRQEAEQEARFRDALNKELEGGLDPPGDRITPVGQPAPAPRAAVDVPDSDLVPVDPQPAGEPVPVDTGAPPIPLAGTTSDLPMAPLPADPPPGGGPGHDPATAEFFQRRRQQMAPEDADAFRGSFTNAPTSHPAPSAPSAVGDGAAAGAGAAAAPAQPDSAPDEPVLGADGTPVDTAFGSGNSTPDAEPYPLPPPDASPPGSTDAFIHDALPLAEPEPYRMPPPDAPLPTSTDAFIHDDEAPPIE